MMMRRCRPRWGYDMLKKSGNYARQRMPKTLRRVYFDIETVPFSDEFRRAQTRGERLRLAPAPRLAVAYVEHERKYSHFTPETMADLLQLLWKAHEIVSFNGSRFDVLVLRRHCGLKRRLSDKGKHIDLCTILARRAGYHVSLDGAAQHNLGEPKHTNGRSMGALDLKGLRVACRSDVRQTRLLYRKHLAGKLEVPPRGFGVNGWRFDDDNYDFAGPAPGDETPETCPKCNGIRTLVFVPMDTSKMTDGQISMYELGMRGFARCRRCKFLFEWVA
jgi:hypothetical protein